MFNINIKEIKKVKIKKKNKTPQNLKTNRHKNKYLYIELKKKTIKLAIKNILQILQLLF